MARFLFLILAFVMSSGGAFASNLFVCAEVRADLTKKPALAALAERAYGPLQYRAWSESQPCAVPTAILQYKTQTVLISTAEPPHQAHACQATLTAHVFNPTWGLVGTHRAFAKSGESCVAGTFKPVTIAGADAFAIEGSGGGQGARAGWLEFYRFDGAGIQKIALPDLTCTSVDFRNAGPAAADMDRITSTWRIGGRNHDRLYLTFMVDPPGPRKPKAVKTVWSLGPQGAALIKGKPPEAFADGACL